jgi:hypothetical protein
MLFTDTLISCCRSYGSYPVSRPATIFGRFGSSIQRYPKSLNLSTYNSFPLRTFHHQFLENLVNYADLRDDVSYICPCLARFLPSARWQRPSEHLKAFYPITESWLPRVLHPVRQAIACEALKRT